MTKLSKFVFAPLTIVSILVALALATRLATASSLEGFKACSVKTGEVVKYGKVFYIGTGTALRKFDAAGLKALQTARPGKVKPRVVSKTIIAACKLGIPANFANRASTLKLFNTRFPIPKPTTKPVTSKPVPPPTPPTQPPATSPPPPPPPPPPTSPPFVDPIQTVQPGTGPLPTPDPSMALTSQPVTGSGPMQPYGGPSAAATWLVKSSRAPTTDNMVSRAANMGAKDVVFMGDSITYYLNQNPYFWQYANSVAPYSVQNLGVGGDKVENLWWRIAQPGAFPVAKVYVIGIGTNNIGEAAADRVSKMSGLRDYILSRQPSARVVFTALWPRIWYETDNQKTNAALRDMVAASDRRTSFVDWTYATGMFKPPAKGGYVPETSWFPDGIHPRQDAWIPVFYKLFPYVAALVGQYGS